MYRANFLDKTIELRGDSHYEIAYLLALLQQCYNNGTFDQVKISKPASKSETLQSRLQQPSTYCMFAKHSNVDDIVRTLRTRDYLQGLLASNYCKPFEYQEFFEEFPSKSIQ